jgi:hypothetical protein
MFRSTDLYPISKIWTLIDYLHLFDYSYLFRVWDRKSVHLWEGRYPCSITEFHKKVCAFDEQWVAECSGDTVCLPDHTYTHYRSPNELIWVHHEKAPKPM